MDCILLAAGRGARLRGVVPQYHKPLLVVDGQSLIVSAIKQAKVAGIHRVIVVVAPENTMPVTALLNDAGLVDANTFIIVQPTAYGPGDAFLYASELVRSERVLLLMADNMFGPNDIKTVMGLRRDVVIGVQTIAEPEIAVRFTRITPNGTYEGPEIDDSQRYDESGFRVWLGPLVVNNEKLRNTLGHVVYDAQQNEELKIGPYLGDVGEILAVGCVTHDVGGVNGWQAEQRS